MRIIPAALLAIFLCSLTTFAFADDDEAANTKFTLNTNAFLDTGPMPVLYTCDGKNISPQLDWVNVPAKTQALAIVLKDPQAKNGTFYHWVVYNIPTSVTTLPEDSSKLPAGVGIAKNSDNKAAYTGPCPPKGSSHTYTFDLYALNSKLDVPAGADGKDVEKLIVKHMIEKAEITGVYSRWLK